jgi:glycosyltransferase involved in cell wall biosynthesis
VTFEASVSARSGGHTGVSVAVPTSARPALLEKCLSSVLHQSRQPEEVIISQDGSDGVTRQVVAGFNGRLPIRHLVNDPPLGQLRNRTQAFAATSRDFVAMLDDDDEWESTFLERTSSALNEHPDCAFCSTDHYLISPEGDVLDAETDAYSQAYGRSLLETGVQEDVLALELAHTCYSLVTTLFRRSALAAIGFFPSDAGTAGDLALFLELGARGFPCVYLGERLGRYRSHPGQCTQTAGRVRLSASQVSTLRGFGRRHRLNPRERNLLAARYRAAVVELAVAHAHARERITSVRTLGHYAEFGWGRPPLPRAIVLVALLLGARSRRRP